MDMEDDVDIIDIIQLGFPRRVYIRPNYIVDIDDLSFFRRFRLTKPTAMLVFEMLEEHLEFDNDLNNSVSPINQLLTAFLFYASNAHQLNIGGEVYRNRKSYFSVNVQLVCDSNLKITNIVARWTGSAHDATIFNNIYLRTRLEVGEFGNEILLGDSGYPLKAFLLIPFPNPLTRVQQLYNQCHIRTRNTIERTNGALKRRFPALCYGLRCKIENALTVIVATAVHNIALTMHEDIPPPSEGVNADELEYLILQGQIPALIIQHVNYDFRNDHC